MHQIIDIWKGRWRRVKGGWAGQGDGVSVLRFTCANAFRLNPFQSLERRGVPRQAKCQEWCCKESGFGLEHRHDSMWMCVTRLTSDCSWRQGGRHFVGGFHHWLYHCEAIYSEVEHTHTHIWKELVHEKCIHGLMWWCEMVYSCWRRSARPRLK